MFRLANAEERQRTHVWELLGTTPLNWATPTGTQEFYVQVTYGETRFESSVTREIQNRLEPQQPLQAFQKKSSMAKLLFWVTIVRCLVKSQLLRTSLSAFPVQFCSCYYLRLCDATSRLFLSAIYILVNTRKLVVNRITESKECRGETELIIALFGVVYS
jgi:hypothetical protein